MKNDRSNDIVSSSEVVVSAGYDGYPSEPPYSPDTPYPEYPLGNEALAGEANQAYAAIRNAMRLLELDAEHYGQKDWDPLGKIVCPGNTVVLKPNFVRNFRETQSGHDACLITHGAVIRAALDYVYIALKGKGRIIIADAPQDDADFDGIRQIAGMDEIQRFYRRHADFEVEVYDLRPEKTLKEDGVIVGHETLRGDPAGYVKVDIGRHSAFNEVSHLCHLLYGSEYDTSELRSHHREDTHEYLISRTVMDADCVIGLPKLKTHKKTGITVCMKNLVGINGNKNWLPHHREGTPAQGGDQFADDGAMHRIERKTMACFRGMFPWFGPARRVLARPAKAIGQAIFGNTNTTTIRSGNWYGNDTTWRMVIDLNRILVYSDGSGCLQDHPVRRVFSIVDGIVGGEGNGPLDPTPKPSGIIVAGIDPVAVELTCARLMGFDYMQLPVLRYALEAHALPVTGVEYGEVVCRSNDQRFDRPLNKFDEAGTAFKPHFGWRGHVELNRSQVPETGTRGRTEQSSVTTLKGARQIK